MYKSEILADSLNPQGDRLTTFKVTFPRIVLAEFNTHRMFSRNSASSRAIPFNKMVKMVEENTFVPIAFQKDHKGMQGNEYLTGTLTEYNWLKARDKAVEQAKILHGLDVTKQLCNRLLEPFMWHTVIITSGKEGLENFFKLRCPQYEDPQGNLYRSKKDYDNTYRNIQNPSPEHLGYDDIGWLQINKSQADIHIQAIAELMWDSYNESTPKQLKAGEFHIPYGDNIDNNEIYQYEVTQGYWEARVKIASARCARISYETLGDNPKIDYEADIKLHDNLVRMEHWSPLEHIARAMDGIEYKHYNRNIMVYNKEYKTTQSKNQKGWCRNFKGFIQYRELVDNK